jgi:hypothetical protein
MFSSTLQTKTEGSSRLLKKAFLLIQVMVIFVKESTKGWMLGSVVVLMMMMMMVII